MPYLTRGARTQGDITGTEKPVLRGKTVLQQPVDVETWKPEEGGGGALELMTLCHKDPGVHSFCVAIEGGTWLVQECEVGTVLCCCASCCDAGCGVR